jgi:hypothetical protein
LRSVDADLKTIPNQWKAPRFRPYSRVFHLRSGRDVEFASQLILACELKRDRVGPVPVRVEPRRRTERELDFAFVRDAKLRRVLQSDWKEGQKTHEASAWKSHVIVCGGLVEGLLVDALSRDPVAAARHYFLRPGESRVPQLGRWSLDALVRAALRLQFLSFETASACQTLRSRRNLVHPAQAATAGFDVTDRVASDARATVHACYSELRRHFSS